MSVSTGDISHLQSANAGSSGGAISASGITSGVKNNVWPDIDATSLAAGGTTYRKTFWKNTNGTDAMLAPVVYTPVMPTNATLELGIGYDSSSDDDAAQGNMTAFGANAVVGLISDGADTRTATIYGLDASNNPVSEAVVLTGASEVLSATTFSKVWMVRLSATDGSRTVTVRQGSGGTTRGTIGPSKLLCFLWVTAGTAKASGIALPDLPAGQNYGVWRKLTWTAGAGTVRPNTLTVQIEENG